MFRASSLPDNNDIIIAEEGGSGKVILLEHGAYKDMDICLMFVNFNFSYSQ